MNTIVLLTQQDKKRAIVQKFLQNKKILTKEILRKIEKEENIEKMYEELVIEKSIQTSQNNYTVSILTDYSGISRKHTLQDFVSYFNARYKALESMLKNRQELQNLTSIARILQKKDREQISFIGLVQDKQYTKNENIVLTLEDQSGTIKVIITKSNTCYKDARDIVFDEVIGVNGFSGNNVIFAQNIIFPDIPLTQELKKSPDEVYAVILSDIHVGSNKFLEKEFMQCISWLNGQTGSEEQRKIAEKVGYIFIVGDLVDGVGIYPKQESELTIKDIYQQYEAFANYAKIMPKDKKIIICPGNHDALRLSEPQPKIGSDFVSSLEALPNVILTTNPSMITVHSSENFPGFNFLMYHGYSYDYYGDTVESIRTSGRHISDRVDLIMKYLLQKRHLAPTHSSTLYIPDPKKDSLVIDKVPDFFISGHIHKACIGNYKGVITISSSCWQAKTDFQEKVGHEPEPCQVPLINLQTRKVILMDFTESEVGSLKSEVRA